MSKTNKITISLILCLISISVLTWCQNNNSQIDENINTYKIETEQTPLLGGEDSVRSQEMQKLVINNWCIWCGKCVSNAPKNFSMNWRTAQVISQEDISNQSITNAIKRCPVSVIEIIEV
jgi:ferredoxin